MKNLFYTLIAISLIPFHEVHAESWIGVEDSKLKSGNVGFDDIPVMIISIINWLLGFIGAISVIMIIYGSVRLGYGAVTGDKETGKKIITAAIIGFIISVSGWFIVNFLLDNF